MCFHYSWHPSFVWTKILKVQKMSFCISNTNVNVSSLSPPPFFLICPSSIPTVLTPSPVPFHPPWPPPHCTPAPHPPQRMVVRVLGMRWAVKSHKLLLLCVWRSNRGAKVGEVEQKRRKKEKWEGRGRFYASTLLNLNRPHSHRCPVLPLFTQTWTSTRTAARVQTQRNTNTSPGTHTHSHAPPSAPASPAALSMWPCTTLTVKTPPPLCFSARVTSQKNLWRGLRPSAASSTCAEPTVAFKEQPWPGSLQARLTPRNQLWDVTTKNSLSKGCRHTWCQCFVFPDFSDWKPLLLCMQNSL